MPKIVQNPKTATQIQKESDERRGIKNKAFKLHIDDVNLIVQTAERLGIPQNQLIMMAVKEFASKH